MSTRFIAGGLLVVALVGVAGAQVSDNLDAFARRYAPVLRQDTASDQDFITSFDFDGDWDGSKNWENQPHFLPRAFVYWSGLETNTHVFLLFAWFHPRDYSRWQLYGRLFGRSGAHENDLEGVLLVVDKEAGPAVVLAEAVFHGRLLKYSADSRYRARPGVETHGALRFEGERPVFHIEASGHGVKSWDGRNFPGGDGVVYRLGAEAGVPSGGRVEDVSYQLLDIESTLWARRHDVAEGSTYAESDRFGREVIGYVFEGHNFGVHEARAPWGWEDELTDVPRGTIFFDPALLIRSHFELPVTVGSHYLPNPFTTIAQ